MHHEQRSAKCRWKCAIVRITKKNPAVSVFINKEEKRRTAMVSFTQRSHVVVVFYFIRLRHLHFSLKCKMNVSREERSKNGQEEYLGYQMRWLVKWLLKCSVTLEWNLLDNLGRCKKKVSWGVFGEGSSRTQREPETTFDLVI